MRTDGPNDRHRDSRRYIRRAGGSLFAGVVKNSVLPRWRSAANMLITFHVCIKYISNFLSFFCFFKIA